MPIQPLYYTLFRGVLSEEGSEERARERERERERHRRFLTSEDMRLYKVIQKCITTEKCKRAAFHISASERHIFCTRVLSSKMQLIMRLPAAARWQLLTNLCSPEFLQSETSKDMIDST